MYDLPVEATGTFKWYLGLKAIFHGTANPDMISEPPPFFRRDPYLTIDIVTKFGRL